MKIELFQTEGCKNCANARQALWDVAHRMVPNLRWRDVDVTKELDYAVELGVMSLPALAVDGKLVFSSLPSSSQLRSELQRRSREPLNGR